MCDQPPNPYAAPLGDIPGPKPLTRAERRALEFYRANRDRHPSILFVALRNLPFWSLLVALNLLFYFAARLPQGPGANGALVLGLLFGTFTAGAVIRDFGYARRIAKSWPLTSRVLDWDEIDRLLDQG